MSELPPDIVTGVLIRMPVKSLLRFRCISKPLCFEIDSPDFAKLHLNHSTNPDLILSRVLGCKLYSLDPHSLYQAHEIDHPLKNEMDNYGHECDKIVIVGSCNGLLCLSISSNQVLIWNLSTRKHLNVHFPRLMFPPWQDSHISIAYGFGYDSLHDDYKLVRIDRIHVDSCSRAFVHSMKSNTWSPISGYPFCVLPDRSAGVFICGALHFIVIRYKSRLIVAIDLAAAEEVYHYREVPPPPEFIECVYCNLGVLNDSLSLTCCLRAGYVGVWVMKDYGVVESWALLCSIPCNELSTDLVVRVKPLFVSNSGKEVILQMDDKKLIRYDLEKNRVHILRIRGSPKSFEADFYVGSLINPMPTNGSLGDDEYHHWEDPVGVDWLEFMAEYHYDDFGFYF